MPAQGGATSVTAVVAPPWGTRLDGRESPNGAALTARFFHHYGHPFRVSASIVLPTQGCAAFVSHTPLHPGLT